MVHRPLPLLKTLKTLTLKGPGECDLYQTPVVSFRFLIVVPLPIPLTSSHLSVWNTTDATNRLCR